MKCSLFHGAVAPFRVIHRRFLSRDLQVGTAGAFSLRVNYHDADPYQPH